MVYFKFWFYSIVFFISIVLSVFCSFCIYVVNHIGLQCSNDSINLEVIQFG